MNVAAAVHSLKDVQDLDNLTVKIGVYLEIVIFCLKTCNFVK